MHGKRGRPRQKDRHGWERLFGFSKSSNWVLSLHGTPKQISLVFRQCTLVGIAPVFTPSYEVPRKIYLAPFQISSNQLVDCRLIDRDLLTRRDHWLCRRCLNSFHGKSNGKEAVLHFLRNGLCDFQQTFSKPGPNPYATDTSQVASALVHKPHCVARSRVIPAQADVRFPICLLPVNV